MQARNRGIVTGIIGGALGKFISLAAPFVVMPAMLRYLGEADFGVWMTAVSLTSAAMFLDFGIGNGLLTRLSRAFGLGDYVTMRSYIVSAYVALTVVAVVLGISLVVVYVIVNSGWVSFTYQVTANFLAIAAACIFTFIFGIPASVIQRVMLACQKTWMSNVWQIMAALLSVVLCLLSIWLKMASWMVVLAYALPPIVMMFCSAFWFFSKHLELKPKLTEFSRAYSFDLLSIGSRFFVLSIFTSIALNIDNFIIAQRLGVEAVTEYSVPARLAGLLGLVVNVLFMPLWAANGEALAKNDYVWLRQTMMKMSFLGGGAILILSILLIALSTPILNLWMGRSFEGQEANIAALCLLSFFMAVTSPFNMLLNSAGDLRVQVMAWSLFLLVTVLAKYWFISGQTVWVVPLISALAYLFIISPFVALSARRIVRG
ncbi:oligosaccharide flippase family protein [Pseudomonas sp. NPDC077649]|uniref:oligosaccharide flippase family protein n=1 Tax=Pseudomonas sp. NPDC077649 TaxID=3364423 RepID=UPI0037CB6A6B